MELEFLPNWIYTFLILPIVVLFQRQFSFKNIVTKEITELKTNQKIYIDKVNKICQSNEELAKEVNQMIGKMDEHFRQKQ